MTGRETCGNWRTPSSAPWRWAAGRTYSVHDLPTTLQYPTTERAPEKEELLPLDELERRAILSTLRQTGGDKQAAARMLGIGKTTLYRKLKQYQIERADV